MKMFDSILSLFKKTEEKHTDSKQTNHIDVLISLNSNFEIDLSLFIDESLMNNRSGALFASEFLHIINSGKLKPQIINLLDQQIRTQDNNNFVDEVLMLDNIITDSSTKYSNNKDSFIKPSSVFAKNSI